MVTHMMRHAYVPPSTLPEYDARMSRIVRVPGARTDRGLIRGWHVLDNLPMLEEIGAEPSGTILAVHGNPTWAYLWRRLLAATVEAGSSGAPAWRVIAVDQLDMGYSERTGLHRPLQQRIDDLEALTNELSLTGPVVTLGHDWGGLISLGWALRHPDSLAGIALLNTAVWQPEDQPIPFPLRLARAPMLRTPATRHTRAFLDTTLSLASPRLPRAVRDAYRAPYDSSAARRGIDGFVADIPGDPTHPSFDALVSVSEGIRSLNVPALLLWGPEDPIFSDRYLDDLSARLPHASIHRFEGAGHLLAEDAPYAPALLDWLETLHPTPGDTAPRKATVSATRDAENPDPAFRPLWAALDDRRHDTAPAVIDMNGRSEPLQISWATLADRVERLANGLQHIGIQSGDRVSLLIPPGATLTAVVYACLRIGATVVVADSGLGFSGLGRAIRGAWPQYLIADTPGLTAAAIARWPGVRVSVRPVAQPLRSVLRVEHTLGELLRTPDTGGRSLPPGPDDIAAILYTSGSTGPAKGVQYTHRQLSAVRDAIATAYAVDDDPGLVTGFAPFALLGPALGTRSVTPRMNISAPRTLTATAVAEAARAASARIAFLSPAAILGVTSSTEHLTPEDRNQLARIERFLSTGAPIGLSLLDRVREVMPRANAHTPYGMTECLLVTDITRDGIARASEPPQEGVCVGVPLPDVDVLISALDTSGCATGTPSTEPGVLGEIIISAPHLKHSYHRLWVTDRASARHTPPGRRMHRTGDIGHLDQHGRLWVEGRLPHIIRTPHGVRAPVGIEQAVETIGQVRRAAAVGIGPSGVQQIVMVVETSPPARRAHLASAGLTSTVRAHSPEPIAAVLVVPELPTDIRHNSKIDRQYLSRWAERILSGGSVSAQKGRR